MLVIVVENAPPRSAVACRCGCGDTGWRLRRCSMPVSGTHLGGSRPLIDGGNAVVGAHRPGFAFDTIGENCREPIDVDGLTLVRFKPPTGSNPATRSD